MEKKILIVDDEKPIDDILKINLQRENYIVFESYDGEDAIQKAQMINPDLILLDVMLPKLDGFSVCRKIRDKSTVPIIMLTAREEEVDKVLGLELGADNYITKPFSVRELMARIKANMRRSALPKEEAADSSGDDILEVGCFKIDSGRYELYKNNQLVDLTIREFDLIKFLATQPNKIFTRQNLLEGVWDYEF